MKQPKTLLNPYALDANGNLISVEHAIKGEEYFCPKCHEPMSYCKKGNGLHAKTDHFRHTVKTNCKGGGESEIHRMAKEQIYNILREYLDNNLEFPITWTCPDCLQQMKMNLLKLAKDVHMEHDLNVARPDIDLLDETGNTIIAIEIVFKHDVEANTFNFYENNNIALIRINIRTAEDCNNMLQKLQYPDSCNLCFNENCRRIYTTQPYRNIFEVPNNGSIESLVVIVDNPYENTPKIGKYFTKMDLANALTKAKQIWPGMEYEYNNRDGYICIVPKQRLRHIPTYPYRRNHLSMDEIDRLRQHRYKNGYKKQYKSKSTSKSSRGYRKRR